MALNKCIINLPHRTDRLEQIRTELHWLFKEDPSFILVDGVFNHDAKLGIAQAHMNCIKIAKANDWDKVLIMEDDCIFQGKDKTLPYFTHATDHPPQDWDILLGGVYDTHGLTPYSEYWNKTKQFCGLHFYIVNHTAYDRLLSYDGKQHYDRFINWNGNDLNCYVANKMFATQRDGFSDNTKLKTDYSNKLKRFQLL